jgi:hypothetical protein
MRGRGLARRCVPPAGGFDPAGVGTHRVPGRFWAAVRVLALRGCGLGSSTEDAGRLHAVLWSPQQEAMTELDRRRADCLDRLRSPTKTPAFAALSPDHALRAWWTSAGGEGNWPEDECPPLAFLTPQGSARTACRGRFWAAVRVLGLIAPAGQAGRGWPALGGLAAGRLMPALLAPCG